MLRYDPERIRDLGRRALAAATELAGLTSDDPAAAGALRAVRQRARSPRARLAATAPRPGRQRRHADVVVVRAGRARRGRPTTPRRWTPCSAPSAAPAPPSCCSTSDRGPTTPTRRSPRRPPSASASSKLRAGRACRRRSPATSSMRVSAASTDRIATPVSPCRSCSAVGRWARRSSWRPPGRSSSTSSPRPVTNRSTADRCGGGAPGSAGHRPRSSTRSTASAGTVPSCGLEATR